MLHFLLFHLAAAVPGGSPSAPPGLNGGLSNLIDWGKWIATGAGLAGVLYSGAKLAHAHQQGGYGGQHHMSLICGWLSRGARSSVRPPRSSER